MRNIPRLLVALFLAITLWRVADFSARHMAAGPLGWLFSIGLGIAVYASAYWTRISAAGRDGGEDIRSKRVRLAAMLCLLAFVLIDGYFNLAAVLQDVKAPELQAAAWIYGLFPTCAAALLGVLQGNIDRLPAPPRRGVSIRVALANRVVGFLQGDEQEIQEPRIDVVHPQALPEVGAYTCEHCGETCKNKQALAAHVRWKHAKRARRVA